MTKGLSENTKTLITQLRTIGNSDEAIATILKIDVEAVKSYRSISLLDPNDDKEEMISLYREGWSIVKIADKFGWSYPVVRKILKESIPGEYRTLKKIDDNTEAEIKHMLANGCSYKEISEKLNVSVWAINKRNNNVKTVNRLSKDEIKKMAYLIYVDKKRIVDIAQQLDVDISTIYRYKNIFEKAGGYEKWLESQK